MSTITPSQTIGPYSAFSLTPSGTGKSYVVSQLASSDLAPSNTLGERIKIEGHVLNGAGVPHRLTMLEFWQADATGNYLSDTDTNARQNSSFTGYGRVETDSEGHYAITTIKPGRVSGPDSQMQAPHILVAIHSPMLLVHLCSRIYFADEAANHDDPILKLVPEERRHTLIARRRNGTYHIDIITQGENETVFFEY